MTVCVCACVRACMCVYMRVYMCVTYKQQTKMCQKSVACLLSQYRTIDGMYLQRGREESPKNLFFKEIKNNISIYLCYVYTCGNFLIGIE